MKRLYVYILLFSFVVIAVCGYLLYFVSTEYSLTISDAVSPDGVTVIIDAGHGGEDGGAVAEDKTEEKDINLAIALMLDEELKSRGVVTLLTRDTDKALYSGNVKTLREKKVSDLHNRMKIMEKTENSIFVSIHQNSYTSSKYSGTQVFYSPNNDAARTLASAIQSSVVNGLQPGNNRVIKECTSSVYLIYNAVRPAVLVECGFMTNPGELDKLKTEEYQRSMAHCIADGIIDFLE